MGAGFNGINGFMFSGFPILFTITFIGILGFIIFRLAQSALQWNKNNHSPELTVEAKVVTKRTDIHHYNQPATNQTMSSSSTSTTYYVTFEVNSGDRMEFHVPDSQYGMLVEGDRGRLTFQGTRFKQFERVKS